MKRLTLIYFLVFLVVGGAFAQGKYIPISAEHYKPIYGTCEDLDIVPPRNGFWFVFSNRDNNPVYNGTREISRVDLGREFLVIGQEATRLKVVDATKVVTDQIQGTWDYKKGESSSTTLEGWIAKENLLLSNECLKVCDIDIPSAPKGLFNLQALYIYNVAASNENHKFFTHIPNNYNANLTRLTISDRFGYIFDVKEFGNEEWFLIGQKPEIKIGGQEIVLKGWKPRSQIEMWKHRLALEYDWYHASDRRTAGIRLSALRDSHTPQITQARYNNSDFVDREYCYFENIPDINHYYMRDIGTGFRNVILEEENNLIRVGVLKNSCNAPPKIINPAREIANSIIKKLFEPKVVFVLDGTASIIADQERKQKILQTINTTISGIRESNEDKVINYQFGASIYRDWAHGQFKFEATGNLTGNIVEVSNWINTNLIRKPGRDLDQPEAVFYGLDNTFKHFQQQIDFFNPTFYVLIGDAGNHNRSDFTNIQGDVIKDYLKCNVSDLSVIQFSHRTDISGDNGASYDDFQSQFKDVLSIFGSSLTQDIEGGIKELKSDRPGSFMAYPERGTQFEADVLAGLIEEALTNYNFTLQQKIRQLAVLLREPENICVEARTELESFIKDYLETWNIESGNIDQVVEWVIRFIENAASNIQSSSDEVIITTDCYNFFNPGYVSTSYDFLEDAPFQHVAYISGNDLDNILQFSGRISALRGSNIRRQIQQTWYYILINVMGVFQRADQVDELTITEATSMLTGFKGNDIYNDLLIGQLTQKDHFNDELLFRYVFEWIITNGYLQSVKNGSWELTPRNLQSRTAVMNALLRIENKPRISTDRIQQMSEEFEKTDLRSLQEYYKNYPSEDIDPLYGLKAFWIETNFFSTANNDFVELLLQ